MLVLPLSFVKFEWISDHNVSFQKCQFDFYWSNSSSRVVLSKGWGILRKAGPNIFAYTQYLMSVDLWRCVAPAKDSRCLKRFYCNSHFQKCWLKRDQGALIINQPTRVCNLVLLLPTCDKISVSFFKMDKKTVPGQLDISLTVYVQRNRTS